MAKPSVGLAIISAKNAVSVMRVRALFTRRRVETDGECSMRCERQRQRRGGEASDLPEHATAVTPRCRSALREAVLASCAAVLTTQQGSRPVAAAGVALLDIARELVFLTRNRGKRRASSSRVPTSRSSAKLPWGLGTSSTRRVAVGRQAQQHIGAVTARIRWALRRMMVRAT